jgi:hypothetical protein
MFASGLHKVGMPKHLKVAEDAREEAIAGRKTDSAPLAFTRTYVW